MRLAGPYCSSLTFFGPEAFVNWKRVAFSGKSKSLCPDRPKEPVIQKSGIPVPTSDFFLDRKGCFDSFVLEMPLERDK